FGKRSAEDCKVLREDEDAASVNQTMTCYNAIASVKLLLNSKIARAMSDQLIELLERPFVQKKIYALASSQLSCCMLLFDSGSPASFFRPLRAIFEKVEF